MTFRFIVQMSPTVPLAAAGDEYGRTTTVPMTTAFTPLASCSSSWTYEPSGVNNVPGGLLLQNAANLNGANPSCFPSGWNHYGRQTADMVYSPGYCPVGYTSASVGVGGYLTTAVCCISDYGYTTLTTEGGNAVYAGCTSVFPSSSTTIVPVRPRQDYGSSTQVTGTIIMWAQPVTVQLQASDSSLFVSSSSTPAPSSVTNAEPTYTSSMPPKTASASATSHSEDNKDDPVSSGLSTGAGIGVGVGVGIGGLAVLAVILGLVFFRRRKKSKQVADFQPQWQVYRSPRPIKQLSPAELAGASDGRHPGVPELYS